MLNTALYARDMWAIQLPGDSGLDEGTFYQRKEAQKEMEKTFKSPWPEIERLGYQCVRVRVQVIPYREPGAKKPGPKPGSKRKKQTPYN